MPKLKASELRLIEDLAAGEKLPIAFMRAGIKSAQPKRYLDKLRKNKTFDETLSRALVEAKAEREITQERVLNEISAIAFADIADFYDDDGRLKPLNEIPPAARKAIVGLRTRVVKETDKNGKEVQKVVPESFELADKLGGLDRLGKHLKLFTDREPGDVTNNLNLIADDKLINRILDLYRKGGVAPTDIGAIAPPSDKEIVDVLPG